MLRKRLLWRLFISYLFITFIILVFVTWHSRNELQKFHRKQSESNLYARAHFAQNLVLHYFEDSRTDQIQELCQELGKDTATRITVIRKDGKVLGDSEKDPASMDNHLDRLEVQEALKSGFGSSVRFSNTLQQNMLYVAIPLTDEPDSPAWIRTSFPLTSIDESLEELYMQMAKGGLVVAIIAAITGLFVSQRISRPLELIKFGAARFAKGDLKYRLPNFDTDEMNSLAQSMNLMASELTEKVRQLEHQRNEEEAVLSSMQEGVLAFDSNGRLILINDAAIDLLEINRTEVMDKTADEFIHDKKMLRLIHKIFKSGKEAEIDQQMNRNNRPHNFKIYGKGWVDKEGKSLGILIVIRDITRLQQLENMRKDFVANVSHELMTPITTIKGFIETLQEGAVNNPEDAQRFLRIISRNSDRLRSIIEDLLALSRIEQDSTQNSIELMPSRIKDVLDESIQLCKDQAISRKIDVRLECQDALKANINSRLIQQAVINLIQNAIKYSPMENEVVVRSQITEENLIIGVIDQGIGIDEEHLARLFERFYRVDVARSRSLGGTGLGLAIVKHICLAHAGNVEVKSEPGKGSTFTIIVPAKPTISELDKKEIEALEKISKQDPVTT